MQASAQPTPRANAGVGWTPFLFLLPFLLFLILFWLVPLVGGVKMSLQANGIGQAEYVGLEHYHVLAKDERFFKAIRNSFVYTLASIVVIVPLSLWLAHLLRSTFRRLRPVLTFALLLPALTPPSVLAVLFLMVFHGKYGLLNQLIVLPLGQAPISWLKDSDFIIHAVPTQHSRKFLSAVKDIIDPKTPLLCLSKGLEVGSSLMMSEVIPAALERDQPLCILSGPTFAVELMQGLPTGIVAASEDEILARRVQSLYGSSCLRVNTSTDVIGVEMSGALKNVLAIAAGIVEGLELGNNAMAALVAQGCAEIRWLAGKLGAKSETLAGLSGTGDIMLTCFVNLSRNRTVGSRLGGGETLEEILGSMNQVAEGVATAGPVVQLAKKHRVSLPVLTAVARILEGDVDPKDAVDQIMNLPQVPEV